MKENIITDAILRSRWSFREADPVYLEKDDVLTPSAKEFVREHHIAIIQKEKYESMTRNPIPTQNGRPVYVEMATGRELQSKPEELTHLRGNLLVPKTHPQIAFRGQLDSLMAQLLLLENRASEMGESELLGDLQELMSFLRDILGAEVKDEPLVEKTVMGMNREQIRRFSHDIKGTLGIDHPIPDCSMEKICLELNLFRTKVREAELCAAGAFQDDADKCIRQDIIQAMNRLSSCVYIVFCRKIAGYYSRRR